MQNTYQEKILDIETTNNSFKKKLEGGIKFKIKSDFQPAGDQPQSIKSLTRNLKDKKNDTHYGMKVEDNVINEIFKKLESKSNYKKRYAYIRKFN